jgi:8-oxo-dGTP diphosphatase
MAVDPIMTAKKPAVAVDIVLLAMDDDGLQVALIKREEDPYFGKHALPGRFVRYDEPIETTARKALELKGKLKTDDIYIEQLYAFGQDLERDTRIRAITIVYCALLDHDGLNAQKDNTFSWHPIRSLPSLAFDHADIIRFAIRRLGQKLWSSDVAFRLAPRAFTLSQLQEIFEALLGKPLDKRNFRKKAEQEFVFKDLKRTHREGAHRPAKLYAFGKLKE